MGSDGQEVYQHNMLEVAEEESSSMGAVVDWL